MTKDKILFIDSETGGVDPECHSLLSIGLAVWQEFRIVDKKEILINDGNLNVTESALSINQIIIEEHVKKAINPAKALIELNTFLTCHFRQDEKIVLAGHNINFDVNFLKKFVNINGLDFYKLFSHRFIDTATILYYLYFSGIVREKIIGSQDAFNYFKIETDLRHTSLGDAVATANLFSALLKIITTSGQFSNKGNAQSISL